MYVDKPQAFYGNVIQTDETKLEYFGKSQQMDEEIFIEEKTIPHVKQGSDCYVLGS